MFRSRSSVWTVSTIVLAFALLAVPATAEVFHVTLTNGTTVDSSVQPQQASWDPSMILLMTEVGNWVGFPKDEVATIKAEDPTAGFGVRISSTAIALGRFSNDLPETGKGNAQDALNDRYLSLANKMLELQGLMLQQGLLQSPKRTWVSRIAVEIFPEHFLCTRRISVQKQRRPE